jgi:hypothetical protein
LGLNESYKFVFDFGAIEMKQALPHTERGQFARGDYLLFLFLATIKKERISPFSGSPIEGERLRDS